jgi:CRP/FNR family nitrogen fixation transcriptional regulator
MLMQTHAASPRPTMRPPQVPGTMPVRGDLIDHMDLMGAAMSFTRNAEIYGEGEPADYLYKVVSGSVRTYKIFDDGRRQIGAFYFPGDVFGLEVGPEHDFSAEAIDNSVVLVVKRSTLVALAERDHEMTRRLWSFTGARQSR